MLTKDLHSHNGVVDYASAPDELAHLVGDLTLRSYLELRYRALRMELKDIERLLGLQTEEQKLRAEVSELRRKLATTKNPATVGGGSRRRE